MRAFKTYPKIHVSMRKAIEVSLEKYKEGVNILADTIYKNSRDCPLCRESLLIALKTNKNTQCSYCPWIRIEGVRCYKAYGGSWLSKSISQRIKRLERWLRIMDFQAKSRKERKKRNGK